MPKFSSLEITALLLSFLPRLGGALLTLALFWLASYLISPVVLRVGRRLPAHHHELLELAVRTARVALRVVGTITALGTLGIDVSALVAGLGLTGFALGFALKDLLSNILAGVLILFYRPFGRGDHVASGGFEGLVTAIDLRYTTLQAGDKRILIPNSNLLTNAIVVHPPPGGSELVQP